MSETAPIRILLVDKDDLTLRDAIPGRRPNTLVARSVDPVKTPILAAQLKPDLAIINCGRTGLASVVTLTRDILASSSSTKALITNRQFVHAEIRAFHHAGAIGFTTYQDGLSEAIQQVTNNKQYLSPSLLAMLGLPPINYRSIEWATSGKSLNKLQQNILLLYAAGHDHRTISERLNIRETASTSALSRAADKLEISVGPALIRFVIQTNRQHTPPPPQSDIVKVHDLSLHSKTVFRAFLLNQPRPDTASSLSISVSYLNNLLSAARETLGCKQSYLRAVRLGVASGLIDIGDVGIGYDPKSR